jgi:hypothetical protein
MIEGLTNQLWTLVKARPAEPTWSWSEISQHRLITFDIVRNNINLPWEWPSLSMNPNVTMDIIEAYPTVLWDFRMISANPNLTTEFILAHVDRFDWKILSRYCGYGHAISHPIDFILSHQELPWDWLALSENQSITIDDMLANPTIPWVWSACWLKRSSFKSVEYVRKYPSHSWQWPWLSSSLKVTLAIVQEFLPNWRWDILSWNENLTTDIISAYPDRPWHWEGLSQNPNISIEFVKDNLHRGWNWCSLTENPAFTFDDIRANIELPWQMARLSRNPNITINVIRGGRDLLGWNMIASLINLDNQGLGDVINDIPHEIDEVWEILSEIVPLDVLKHNPGLPWDSFALSRNPNITADYIFSHQHLDWSWYSLSLNKFNMT